MVPTTAHFLASWSAVAQHHANDEDTHRRDLYSTLAWDIGTVATYVAAAVDCQVAKAPVHPDNNLFSTDHDDFDHAAALAVDSKEAKKLDKLIRGQHKKLDFFLVERLPMPTVRSLLFVQVRNRLRRHVERRSHLMVIACAHLSKMSIALDPGFQVVAAQHTRDPRLGLHNAANH